MSSRKKNKRNKHCNYVRETFRQAQLARGFATGQSSLKSEMEKNYKELFDHLGTNENKPRKLKEEASKRRRIFLQRVLVQESFVCKTLGTDRNGMCIRHPNQSIFQIPLYESIGPKSPTESTNCNYKMHEAFTAINTCRICRSEASQVDSGGQTAPRHQPAMINVIEEVQQLQSNKKEWKKRTSILGMQSSHHGKAGVVMTPRPTKGKWKPDSQIKEEDDDSGSSWDEFGGDNDDDGLTRDEWLEFARFRIIQVRSWEDRFAIKHHPIFCHYFKMLQIGVPLEAVKHDVETDGYHRSIMDLMPNRSLELQLDQLSKEALENLRSKGALRNHHNKKDAIENGDSGENTSEDDDDDESSDGSVEVSIPDTLKRFLSSFRRRRSNQILAAIALLDETKYALLEKSKNKDAAAKSSFIDTHNDNKRKTNQHSTTKPDILANGSSVDPNYLVNDKASAKDNHVLRLEDNETKKSHRTKAIDPPIHGGDGVEAMENMRKFFHHDIGIGSEHSTNLADVGKYGRPKKNNGNNTEITGYGSALLGSDLISENIDDIDTQNEKELESFLLKSKSLETRQTPQKKESPTMDSAGHTSRRELTNTTYTTPKEKQKRISRRPKSSDNQGEKPKEIQSTERERSKSQTKSRKSDPSDNTKRGTSRNRKNARKSDAFDNTERDRSRSQRSIKRSDASDNTRRDRSRSQRSIKRSDVSDNTRRDRSRSQRGSRKLDPSDNTRRDRSKSQRRSGSQRSLRKPEPPNNTKHQIHRSRSQRGTRKSNPTENKQRHRSKSQGSPRKLFKQVVYKQKRPSDPKTPPEEDHNRRPRRSRSADKEGPVRQQNQVRSRQQDNEISSRELSSNSDDKKVGRNEGPKISSNMGVLNEGDFQDSKTTLNDSKTTLNDSKTKLDDSPDNTKRERSRSQQRLGIRRHQSQTFRSPSTGRSDDTKHEISTSQRRLGPRRQQSLLFNKTQTGSRNLDGNLDPKNNRSQAISKQPGEEVGGKNWKGKNGRERKSKSPGRNRKQQNENVMETMKEETELPVEGSRNTTVVENATSEVLLGNPPLNEIVLHDDERKGSKSVRMELELFLKGEITTKAGQKKSEIISSNEHNRVKEDRTDIRNIGLRDTELLDLDTLRVEYEKARSMVSEKDKLIDHLYKEIEMKGNEINALREEVKEMSMVVSNARHRMGSAKKYRSHQKTRDNPVDNSKSVKSQNAAPNKEATKNVPPKTFASKAGEAEENQTATRTDEQSLFVPDLPENRRRSTKASPRIHQSVRVSRTSRSFTPNQRRRLSIGSGTSESSTLSKPRRKLSIGSQQSETSALSKPRRKLSLGSQQSETSALSKRSRKLSFESYKSEISRRLSLSSQQSDNSSLSEFQRKHEDERNTKTITIQNSYGKQSSRMRQQVGGPHRNNRHKATNNGTEQNTKQGIRNESPTYRDVLSHCFDGVKNIDSGASDDDEIITVNTLDSLDEGDASLQGSSESLVYRSDVEAKKDDHFGRKQKDRRGVKGSYRQVGRKNGGGDVKIDTTLSLKTSKSNGSGNKTSRGPRKISIVPRSSASVPPDEGRTREGNKEGNIEISTSAAFWLDQLGSDKPNHTSECDHSETSSFVSAKDVIFSLFEESLKGEGMESLLD